MFGIKSKHGFLLLAGAIIALTTPTEGILDCGSVNSIEAAYKSCLHKEDIDIKIIDHNSASLEDALVSEHAEEFCSYPKESYGNAMQCIGEVTRRCVPESYRSYMPSPQQWREMMARICDHRQDLDLRCAATQGHAANECGKRKAQQFLQERGRPSESDIRCWVFEAEFDCVLDLYKSCGCKTVQVYSDIVLDIMMPSACGQKRELDHRRLVCHDTHEPSTPLPVLPDNVTPGCGSVTALKRSVVECFNNEEIHDNDIFSSFVNSAAPPNTVIESLFLHYGDSACSTQKLRYQEAFKCTLRVVRECTPESFKQFLPNPNTAAAHINYMCEHRKDINLLCASKRNTALQACAKHKGMDYAANGGSTSDMHGILCFAYKAEFECIQEVFKACGCDTAKIYSDMSLDLRYPKTCSRQELEQKRLKCPHHYTHHDVDIKTPDREVTYNMDSNQCVTSRFQEIKKCYADRGFKYTEDTHNTKYHIFYGSILDKIMIENNDICSSRRQLAAWAAIRCEAELIQFCLPAEEKTLFSSPEKLIEVLNGLCDNWQEIDSSCAYREMHKVGQCHGSLTNSGTYNDLAFEQRRSCRFVKQMGDCIKSNLLTCGCPTAKAYSDVIYGVMLPSACRSSDTTPQYMKCDASNPYTYQHQHRNEDGNGVGRLSCTVWSLAIAACLARLVFHYL